jgi:hypothetical protein
MDRQAMDSLLVLTSFRTCYCKLLMSQQLELWWHLGGALSETTGAFPLNPLCTCNLVMGRFGDAHPSPIARYTADPTARFCSSTTNGL